MNYYPFKAKWTQYRIIMPDGTPRRLMKVRGAAEKIKIFQLLSKDGEILDEEKVPPDIDGEWHFGFWVPEENLNDLTFYLRIVGLDDEENIELSPGVPPEGDSLPLRLDRTGDWLQRHLRMRESLPPARALADFVPDMGRYLHQHRVIYERPAEHWGEGLPLGNGTVGALVTGKKGASQTIYLDRTDQWATLPSGRPIGRVYSGELCLRYSTIGKFRQELSLYKGEVTTQDGDMETVMHVNAERDLLEVNITWNGDDTLNMEVEICRKATPLLEVGMDVSRVSAALCNGSWQRVTSQKEIDTAKRLVKQGPYSKPSVSIGDRVAVIMHPLPNISCAIAASIGGVEIKWKDVSQKRTARAKTEIAIPPRGKVAVFVAVTADHSGGDPVEKARQLLIGQKHIHSFSNDQHLKWWRDFWERSFIELPDKFMENMWYLGTYLQACFSRSLNAASFFGLWHPLDYRTWDEGYFSNAQTSLMWWASFATNHLELMLPSHNTFARMFVEFLEHNPGEGALVPHKFFPEWAGGHFTFGKPNKFKGSIAWMGLNFWWDYLYTLDHEFLASIAYPVIAACADYHANDLVKESDGRFHCLKSGAPEQNNTSRDNIYDRACIEAILRAAITAAKILKVDNKRAEHWQYILDNLFPFPSDEKTLLETKENPHPYRCHPSVMFGIHPTGCIEPGSPLWDKSNTTYEILTNIIGHTYEDRHRSIPGHKGGIEPTGFTTAFLMHSVARLRGWKELQRIYYATVPFQLKRNGLLSICDPRHSKELTNMAVVEATSGQTSGISEIFVQNYSNYIHVFGAAGRKGVFRFSGLRAWGGFVLSGECVDGVVQEIVVYSLKGKTLYLINPWKGKKVTVEPEAKINIVRLPDGSNGLELKTKPQEVYHLQPLQNKVSSLSPVIESRECPREIHILDWDNFDPPVVYYPEDPPFSQFSKGDRVFLGMPRKEMSETPAINLRNIEKLANHSDWRSRQTAARWLGRMKSIKATNLLVKIIEKEKVPVVMYTAGVSLIRQGTAYSLSRAFNIAYKTSIPHLRREIFKAIRRLSHTEEGVSLLVECFTDLNTLELIFEKNKEVAQ